MKLEYYNTDTGCELAETELLISRLETYLGGITMLRAAAGSPEPTPFEHFLKASGNYLPSPQARWCTQKMKLAQMEKFVGDAPTISYVGIRGDEDREGMFPLNLTFKLYSLFARIFGVGCCKQGT
jgi:3'-phosphoadenosine 5'-phosphosulfate sulfotransferase (PAPS reductase)/FAD synthetase